MQTPLAPHSGLLAAQSPLHCVLRTAAAPEARRRMHCRAIAAAAASPAAPLQPSDDLQVGSPRRIAIFVVSTVRLYASPVCVAPMATAGICSATTLL